MTSPQILWDTMIIHDDKKEEIINVAKKILANKNRYDAVAEKTGIPWYVIGVIHNRESSLNFTRHLHNGDSLEHRTVHVPAGRPKHGEPPFAWEQSAEDALEEIEIEDKTHAWSITNMLYHLESYNGFGYRNHNVYSPYLWSFTNHYIKGKFGEVFDAVKQRFIGVYQPNLVDEQVGCVPLIRYLTDKTLGIV